MGTTTTGGCARACRDLCYNMVGINVNRLAVQDEARAGLVLFKERGG